MATFEPHAAAAELTAEATAARVAAAQEAENLAKLRAALDGATGDEREALAFQVRRSERIVEALEATTQEKLREAVAVRGY